MQFILKVKLRELKAINPISLSKYVWLTNKINKGNMLSIRSSYQYQKTKTSWRKSQMN